MHVARGVGMVLAVVALAGCGSTAAPDAEQVYLAQMRQHPAHYPGTDLPIPDQVVVGLGNLACTMLRNPQVTDAHTVTVAPTGYGHLSGEDTTAVVESAADNLCPDVRSKLG